MCFQRRGSTWARRATSRAIRNCSTCSATRSPVSASARNSIRFVLGLAKDVPNVRKTHTFYTHVYSRVVQVGRSDSGNNRHAMTRTAEAVKINVDCSIQRERQCSTRSPSSLALISRDLLILFENSARRSSTCPFAF